VDPLPLARIQAVLDGADPESGFESLLTTENTELPGSQSTQLSFFV
jgi:hypothetical protein